MSFPGCARAWPEPRSCTPRALQFVGDDESGIAAAVDLCNDADAVVLCIGEMADMSGEAASRAFPEVPPQQRVLAEAVFERAQALGLRVRCRAVLGTSAGHSLAGREGGRRAWRRGFWVTKRAMPLPMLCWADISQRAHTNELAACHRTDSLCFSANVPAGGPTTRKIISPASTWTCRTNRSTRLGTAYLRTFRLANSRVTPDSVSEKDTIEARVDVTNEGAYAAEETVFLFTHDKVASVTRPLLELKGVGKVRLRPGETRTVRITVPASDLRFLGLGPRAGV